MYQNISKPLHHGPSQLSKAFGAIPAATIGEDELNDALAILARADCGEVKISAEERRVLRRVVELAP